MKLIALRPCSFGGRKFYIGDEIPEELVLSPKLQKERGTIQILEDLPETAVEEKPAVVEERPVSVEEQPAVVEDTVVPAEKPMRETPVKRTGRKKSGK